MRLWVADWQVEQDLVISRTLVELFSRRVIAEALAFRGGKALYKLHLHPARYSEDIDLVQATAGAIGPVLDEIHATLDGWLGKPQWKQTAGRVTLAYRFDSEHAPPLRLKLKLEINTREHLSALGLIHHPFKVDSRWFVGAADIPTYKKIAGLIPTPTPIILETPVTTEEIGQEILRARAALTPSKPAQVSTSSIPAAHHSRSATSTPTVPHLSKIPSLHLPQICHDSAHTIAMNQY